MAISTEQKKEFIETYGSHETDSGNSKVQIAILTFRIRELTEHVKINKKDSHTRLGLMKLVGKRRRMLRYLERVDVQAYRGLIDKLGIRK